MRGISCKFLHSNPSTLIWKFCFNTIYHSAYKLGRKKSHCLSETRDGESSVMQSTEWWPNGGRMEWCCHSLTFPAVTEWRRVVFWKFYIRNYTSWAIILMYSGQANRETCKCSLPNALAWFEWWLFFLHLYL